MSTSGSNKKKILELFQQNLDELLKNELNHEEPPWRTPVTKGWRDRMKGERIRWALRWFRWRFRQNSRGKFKLWKRKDEKHLELEFIHQEQTLKEGITHLDEIRIRFIVCLSFIKLNWWQTMDFCILLILLGKGLRSNTSQTWEGLHEPPVG